MRKKGVLGLDTATAFVLAILILAVIGFVLVISLSNLNTVANNNAIRLQGTPQSNETVSTVNAETAVNLAPVDANRILPVCTVGIATNATGGETIPATNYTVSACTIIAVGPTYNSTDWNVSYTYTFANPDSRDTLRNVTAGTRDFFTNAGTWFSLLSVVIIILIVAVVIIAVRRFGGGSSSAGGGLA